MHLRYYGAGAWVLLHVGTYRCYHQLVGYNSRLRWLAAACVAKFLVAISFRFSSEWNRCAPWCRNQMRARLGKYALPSLSDQLIGNPLEGTQQATNQEQEMLFSYSLIDEDLSGYASPT